jgi:hypothetical protein
VSTVPLRYRLPNPPSDFVGREDELSAVADALETSPVTVVTGPGGVGKTALALATLHRRFPKRVPRTLYVSLPAETDGLEARQELLRALALSTRTEIGWAHLQDDPDALTEALLDLAEEHSFWLLIDDLHHLPASEAEDLVVQLARYARTSRYLFSSRRTTRPGSGATIRLIEVGGLDDVAALELAQHVAGERPPEALSEAVRTSGGSPWLLREALLASPSAEPTSPGDTRSLLVGLDEATQRFARMAATLELPVPAADLASATGVAESSWRPPLEARGWLEEGPAGVRLHEVAQQGITRGGKAHDPSDTWLPMARALSRHESIAVRLDAVRLLILGGDFTSVEEVLEDELSDILAEGYAPKLWKLLTRAPEDRLQGARLRCAAELGSPTVLRQLPRPLGDSSIDRLTWAETRYMKGDLAGALDALATLDKTPRAAGESEEWRFDAELLRCRILVARDEIADAERRLLTLSPTTEDEATRRDAILASLAEVVSARRSETLVELASLERRCTALGGRDRALARFHVAMAYFRNDAPDAAEAALGPLTSSDAIDALALFETRRAAWLHAALDVARGRLDSAQNRLELLEPFLHSPSLIRADVYMTRARLWMVRGEFRELPALIEQARTEAVSLGLHAAKRRAARLAARVQSLLLRDPEAHTRAEATLASLEQQAATLERSLADLIARGLWSRAAEQRSQLCSLLLVSKKDAAFDHALQALRTLTNHMGSLRFAAESDLLRMAREVDLARLEAIAAHPDLSPVAGRRAQALLGGETEGDAVDRAVVSRVAMPSLELVVPPEDSSSWQPGWGVDLTTRRVWFPSGEWLDLSRRALHLRLLLALARRGGTASKEELVRDVWEEREYHPLRHDTRLQVTVHKLRDLLEDDPKAPRRLVTTVGGYGLAGPFRLAGRE